MKKVFVSGCYDIVHAGHVQFFRDAKSLGDELTVCFASAEVLWRAKSRLPAMPDADKYAILSAFEMIDRVVVSSDLDPIFDFVRHIDTYHPDIIAITDDDRHVEAKRAFCKERGIELVMLSKKTPTDHPTSTTSIRSHLAGRISCPLRIDFAGGWLDVPEFTREGGYIVNATFSPLVSLSNWMYQIGGGLGGSAAHAWLSGREFIAAEIGSGVGWQDAASIAETGLCVWRSGPTPVLHLRRESAWLDRYFLLVWTYDRTRTSAEIKELNRDFDRILRASQVAARAVESCDPSLLDHAIDLSYEAQLWEGMSPLDTLPGVTSCKYLGAGHGGYALYVFASDEARESARGLLSERICHSIDLFTRKYV